MPVGPRQLLPPAPKLLAVSRYFLLKILQQRH